MKGSILINHRPWLKIAESCCSCECAADSLSFLLSLCNLEIAEDQMWTSAHYYCQYEFKLLSLNYLA